MIPGVVTWHSVTFFFAVSSKEVEKRNILRKVMRKENTLR
jgi:hypothetical protein